MVALRHLVSKVSEEKKNVVEKEIIVTPLLLPTSYISWTMFQEFYMIQIKQRPMWNQQMQFWIRYCDKFAFQPGNQVSFAEVRPEIVMEHGDLEEEGHSHDCHGHSHDHLEEHLDMEGHGHSHSIFEPCCLASWIQLILLVVGVLLVLLVLFVRITTR